MSTRLVAGAIAAVLVVLGPVPIAVAAEPDAAPACRPACRSGFTCVDGACVSACNPACPAGQRCSAAGDCETVDLAAVGPDEEPGRPSVVVGFDFGGALAFGWYQGLGVNVELNVGGSALYFTAFGTVDVGLSNDEGKGRERDWTRVGGGLGARFFAFLSPKMALTGLFGASGSYFFASNGTERAVVGGRFLLGLQFYLSHRLSMGPAFGGTFGSALAIPDAMNNGEDYFFGALDLRLALTF